MKKLLQLAGILSLVACNAFADKTETPAVPGRGRAEHIVVVVWDGMRPDFATAQYAPTLYKLSQEGVFFQMQHSVYVTSTEVNGTALATGVYPNRSHIIANREYRPDIDPLTSVAMESYETVLKGDALGKYIGVPTLEETLQNAGRRTVIAGTKAVALLPDRSTNRVSDAAKNSMVIFSGTSIPPAAAADAAQALGTPFPPTVTFPNRDADAWTTRALTEFLWKKEVPAFSLLWMSDPDYSQHSTAPGSPISLGAIKSVDDNLATVLAALDAKGVRDKTDVFVVSDHGFSTIDKANNIVDELKAAGFDATGTFKEPPKQGQIMVVNLGGSVLFYVIGHDAAVTRKLVDYLQGQDLAGVIFTREKMEGTFTLGQARVDSPAAPDVMIALHWTELPNKYGIPGSMTADSSRKPGQGTHATLSKFEVHNTLVAAGPDFKRGAADTLPTANVDVAPTILWILGVKPAVPLDGRVLFEAMTTTEQGQKNPPTESTVTAERNDSGVHWRQYLKFTQLGPYRYLDEGNGGKP